MFRLGAIGGVGTTSERVGRSPDGVAAERPGARGKVVGLAVEGGEGVSNGWGFCGWSACGGFRGGDEFSGAADVPRGVLDDGPDEDNKSNDDLVKELVEAAEEGELPSSWSTADAKAS